MQAFFRIFSQNFFHFVTELVRFVTTLPHLVTLYCSLVQYTSMEEAPGLGRELPEGRTTMRAVPATQGGGGFSSPLFCADFCSPPFGPAGAGPGAVVVVLPLQPA